MGDVRSDASSDEALLEQFGYRQELRRELRRFASFAVGFSFISITTGIFTTFGSVLGWGGPLGIWTWPAVIVGQLLVALVFGALAARIPLAGYSYQWMSRLGNPVLGWLVGWIMFGFLIVDVVAVDYALAQTVLPVLFTYPSTASTAWIGTAIVIVVQGLLIALSTRLTALVNSIAVGTEIAGIVGLTLALFVVALVTGHLHGANLFSSGTVPRAGYFSIGSWNHDSPFELSFLLGAFTIVGFEAAANMAEETRDAVRTVPRVMWQSVLLSGILGFAFLVVLDLTATHLAALATSATPVSDIVVANLGNVVGKLFLILVTFSIFACGLVIYVTATRLTWAMSRDGKFPAAQLLRTVNRRFDSPLAATVTVGLLLEVVLAIFSRQSSALSDLFSAATLLPALIYAITVVLYAVTRRTLPPSRGFSLGRWEGAIIAVALVWLAFELSIFRDASFAVAWEYVGAMIVVGLIFLGWLLAVRRQDWARPDHNSMSNQATSDR
jgi:amino acid transporter